MTEADLKVKLDTELNKIVQDVNGRIYSQIEQFERLNRLHTSTPAMRKAKKRERLNRARGRK